jgi:hypothetical protein
MAQWGTHVQNPVREAFCDQGEDESFHDLLRQKASSLLILGWRLISNASPLITVRIYGFGGEDVDVMDLNVVPQVYAVLCHG